MYYLITYQQWTGHQDKVANALTENHPANWLREESGRHPEANTVLINAIELTKAQYDDLRDWV